MKLLDSHKNKIIKELNFKHKPIVLFGDEALSFVSKYVSAYNNKSDKQILSKIGGCFLYEKLPQNYIYTGVVCILNGEIGTLAHELLHAKQYQDNNKWMQRGKWLKFVYKIGYGFYPTEREAFRYAATYLKKSKLYKLALFYDIKILFIKFFGTVILWPIYFICFTFFYLLHTVD
jgi:hypothetical protein